MTASDLHVVGCFFIGCCLLGAMASGPIRYVFIPSKRKKDSELQKMRNIVKKVGAEVDLWPIYPLRETNKPALSSSSTPQVQTKPALAVNPAERG
jgi:hypothetical protein